MFFAINTGKHYADPLRVRKFEEEKELKSFLLSLEGKEKGVYTVIEGQELKYSVSVSVELKPKGEERLGL